MKKARIYSLLMFIVAGSLCHAQKTALQDFPKGFTPEEVGHRLAYHFVDAKHEFWGGNTKYIGYHEICTWNGAVMFGRAAGDQRIVDLMRDRFEPFFGPEKEFLPIKNHVDMNMFGSLPLMLYQVYKDERYKEMGLSYADTQWELPKDAKESQKRLARNGYTWQTRMWIDDMYMITIVQSWAYRVTGDRKYIDRAAHEMVKYLDELQRPNGLFYHAPDAPYYWCRGNGWMAVGMTEVLKALPKDNPYYKRILKGYRLMMKSLLKYRNEEGIWNQLVDQPDFWTETSGSGMFTYAFICGVKEGWLSAKTYGPAARKAWLALIPYINNNDDVREVCVGTNKKADFDYYLDRPRVAGDYHGQAPYLWCAAALLE